MTIDLYQLRPQPLRLGQCGRCPYRDTGNAMICYACAKRDFTELSGGERCIRCGRELQANGECPNYVCGWPSRTFDRNYAVAARRGRLKAVADAQKFEGVTGFAVILGRILVGFLNANAQEFRQFDVILPSPAFHGMGARRDHAREVFDAAAAEAGATWPFIADEVITRTAEVPALKGQRWKDKREIAEKHLSKSLHVSRPAIVRGRRVLVFDDIFTDGFTLREVAKVLRTSGAIRVSGLTLMRQLPTNA